MSTTKTTDPVVALVAERFRIEEEADARSLPVDDDDAVAAIVDLAGEQIARLDEQIATVVAISAAGLIGQVRVLHELGQGVYGDDDVDHDGACGDRLRDTIVIGIERLAGGASN